MALWELDAFKPPQLLGFIRAIPTPATFAGTTWLPNRTVFDLDFEYILGAQSRPVMAHIMGFDSEAPIHGRPGLGERVRGSLPPIKRKAKISEKEIIRFLNPRSGVPDVDTAIRSVYELFGDLVDGVNARMEWLRMQALSENTVVYDEGGVIFNFDFGYNDRYQINLTTTPPQDGAGNDVSAQFSVAWSDTVNSDPIADLGAICDRIESGAVGVVGGDVVGTGRRPAEFICSAKTLRLLLSNTNVRNLVRGSSAPAAVLTRAELDTVFTLYSLPTIVTYDVLVTKENDDGTYTDVRAMAENKAFLVPPGRTVGNTLFGPTAEASVLYGTSLATAAPGVFGNTYATTEPPAEWTKVAAVGFPSIPQANLIGQMTLY